MKNSNDDQYLQIADADDVDDGIVVRIWRLNGDLVGEADHPSIEEASTGRLIVNALGNTVPVRKALNRAQQMRIEMPMFTSIYVQLENHSDWDDDWGKLLPEKRSAIVSKPFY